MSITELRFQELAPVILGTVKPKLDQEGQQGRGLWQPLELQSEDRIAPPSGKSQCSF